MSNNGGSAFPNANSDGMTLRDWFAGQALAGYMALRDERTFPNKSNDKDIEEWRAWLKKVDAEFLYAMADAMLKARSTNDETEIPA